jgi:hypothetical protein
MACRENFKNLGPGVPVIKKKIYMPNEGVFDPPETI